MKDAYESNQQYIAFFKSLKREYGMTDEILQELVNKELSSPCEPVVKVCNLSSDDWYEAIYRCALKMGRDPYFRLMKSRQVRNLSERKR
jgi:hypothetical protein